MKYTVKFSHQETKDFNPDNLNQNLQINILSGNGFMVDEQTPNPLFKRLFERVIENVKNSWLKPRACEKSIFAMSMKLTRINF